MSRSIRLRFVIIIITQRSLVTQLVMEKKEKKKLLACALSLSLSLDQKRLFPFMMPAPPPPPPSALRDSADGIKIHLIQRRL